MFIDKCKYKDKYELSWQVLANQYSATGKSINFVWTGFKIPQLLMAGCPCWHSAREGGPQWEGRKIKGQKQKLNGSPLQWQKSLKYKRFNRIQDPHSPPKKWSCVWIFFRKPSIVCHRDEQQRQRILQGGSIKGLSWCLMWRFVWKREHKKPFLWMFFMLELGPKIRSYPWTGALWKDWPGGRWGSLPQV